ncbi:MAG TPA: hypothetical protein VMQ81_04050 [Acidimicrobiia bacterium]|nr:hypothetical protein [Acidimicrobiia bacterium]
MSEADAAARLEQSSAEIVAGVERCLPGWVERQVERILDAWGRLDPDARTRALEDARAAGVAATARVADALRAVLAAPIVEQRATPLEIVRSAYREPTGVLAAAGVPPVVRDEFDERAWPDDRYGLVPRTLGDLGDEDLGPLLLAWGMAKAASLRGE